MPNTFFELQESNRIVVTWSMISVQPTVNFAAFSRGEIRLIISLLELQCIIFYFMFSAYLSDNSLNCMCTFLIDFYMLYI